MCVISNIAGRDENQVKVEVKGHHCMHPSIKPESQWHVLYKNIENPSSLLFFSEPIVIVTKPQSMKVIRGTDVRLECAVKADATTPFTTTWIKNKKQISFGWR